MNITTEDRERIHKLACEVEYDMGNNSTTEQLCELGERITKYERRNHAHSDILITELLKHATDRGSLRKIIRAMCVKFDNRKTTPTI